MRHPVAFLVIVVIVFNCFMFVEEFQGSSFLFNGCRNGWRHKQVFRFFYLFIFDGAGSLTISIKDEDWEETAAFRSVFSTHLLQSSVLRAVFSLGLSALS